MTNDTITEMHDGGWIRYWKTFFAQDEANRLFETLRRDVPWEQMRSGFMIFPRLTSFAADVGIDYTYTRVTHRGAGWTPVLLEIKNRLEAVSGEAFNGVLLNLYRNGKDSVAYHSDSEPELGVNPVVASISLGADRSFSLRHKITKEKLRLTLANGSLLVMGGTLQHHWEHEVPKTSRPVGERINLTFRRFIKP